jgi:polysaccharide export outer membrane protein
MTISSNSFKSLLTIFVLSLLVFSCKTREKLVYLQGADAGPALQTNYQPVLRTDDQLLIQVGGSEMEALAPFQFYYMGNQQSMGGQQAMQMLQSISYIIDINGNINFPQLGFVKLAGLTRLQAVELLQSRLSEYVSNPTVHIQVMNFKYSILGQVRSPGLYNCPTERFTILEAIAQAGDLQATGLRKNVLVVREQNGQRIEYRLDLTSKDVYLSPAYYIRQNDVIYVEPNFTANFQGTNVQIFTQLSSTALSLILTVFTLISLSK